jgi:nucleotide-binding universal stress UspA family protein
MNDMRAPQILVPTDFSEHSMHALRYAASLGERFGATLHLVHVLTVHGLVGHLEEEEFPDLAPLLAAADGAARARLDAGAEHGGAAEATVVRAVLRGINPWDEIVAYALRESANLIVMATHSASILARFLLGSVTERVLRLAPCPVLVIEKGDRDFVDPETMAVRLGRVVVADDLSDKTERALSYAREWLAPYRPEIHLVHAVELEVPEPYLVAGVTSVFALDPDLKRRLSAMLAAHASHTLPADWKVTTELREGRPHWAVPAYAAEVEADLLVVAGESHIDLAERIMGGTVERIARHAPCPMLVV